MSQNRDVPSSKDSIHLDVHHYVNTGCVEETWNKMSPGRPKVTKVILISRLSST